MNALIMSLFFFLLCMALLQCVFILALYTIDLLVRIIKRWNGMKLMNDIEKHKPIAMAICRAVEDDDEIVEQEWINYVDQAKLARIAVLDGLIKETNREETSLLGETTDFYRAAAYWLSKQKESL